MVGRTFLGRYEAIRLLGEGGMGRVYLAKQADLGRQVVVKVMHDHIASDPKFHERFQRETLLMARFQHPYVVTLYDASLNDPQGPCIVMEYIKGVSLDQLLTRNTGRLNAGRVCRLLGQLCEALQAAHAEGIIHRDLKPSNLMVVDPDTPYEKIKVMDFGLAKLVNGTRGMGMMHKTADTGADFAVGTPGYISPEQVRGEELDHRSDLYSVGVILYELLTGQLPFQGDETMDVLLAHATEPPPSFAQGGIDTVPPDVEAVVMQCLAKNPADRPSSAHDLVQMFTEAMALAAERPKKAPEPTPEEATATAHTVIVPQFEANAITHMMEAWMPDTIATYKLSGFIDDMGGQILENIPGKIRVRLGGPGTALSGGFSWFGLRRRNTLVDMELRLERNNPKQPNQLHITVQMRAPNSKIFADPEWRDRCSQIFIELRSYLAGANVVNA